MNYLIPLDFDSNNENYSERESTCTLSFTTENIYVFYIFIIFITYYKKWQSSVIVYFYLESVI